MRLLIHTDFEYHRVGREIRGEHAFTLFFVQLASRAERVVLLGRLGSRPERGRYPLGASITFVALPYYESVTHLAQLLRGLLRTMGRFWTALDDVDVVWLLGPNPVQLAFVAMAALRGRRIALAARQDFKAYVVSRHPDRRWPRIVAPILEGAWRGLARICPVVVVGPALARQYGHARRLIEITASLVSERDLTPSAESPERDYEGTARILSVGRLEAEKNPLLLADILSILRAGGGDWQLVVCGEGPLARALVARLEELGVNDRARLLGYVPHGPRLTALYRECHLLLHVSWTEGLPQVLLEAFATSLPVVATDVGGISAAVGEAAALVAPGNEVDAAEACREVFSDANLRRHLVKSGDRFIRDHTLEVEASRVAGFLAHS